MSAPKAGLSASGAVLAALLASACCIGPAVLAVAGLGGAASALVLAPYRPYLLGLSLTLLGAAFFFTYRRPRAACCPDGSRPSAPAGRGGKALPWLASLVVVLLAALFLFTGGRRAPIETRHAEAATGAASRRAGALTTTTVTIKGMTCGGCVARVEDRLDRVAGVVGFEVSLASGEARVSYDPAATTPEAIAAAVSETGFAAAVKERPAP